MSPSVKKLWRWMNKVIAKPRDNIGGHAICPYLAQYMDQLLIVEDTDPEQVIKNYVVFRKIFNLEAVVVVGIDWDFDTLTDWCATMCKKYKSKDIEVLGMAPDSEEPPLPFTYTYSQPLVIIQTRSTLTQARKSLAKTTDYYSYYKG